MPETAGAEALEIAERLREKMGDVAEAAGLPGEHVSTSVGVADMPVCAVDGASLIFSADAALLYAKREGRNRVVYVRDLSETELHESTIDSVYTH